MMPTWFVPLSTIDSFLKTGNRQQLHWVEHCISEFKTDFVNNTDWLPESTAPGGAYSDFLLPQGETLTPFMSDKNCLTLYPHLAKTWTNKPITDPRLTDVIFFSNTNIGDYTHCWNFFLTITGPLMPLSLLLNRILCRPHFFRESPLPQLSVHDMTPFRFARISHDFTW